MKALLVIIAVVFCLNADAQNIFAVRPVAEKVDTIILHTQGKTYAIYKYKDGSAWVQDRYGVEYLSKRKFRKWKRENVKL